VPVKHKSVQKRHRQSLVRNRRNRTIKSKIRTALKSFDSATAETRDQALRNAVATADKAVAKNVIHKNKARRMRSQLMRRANKAAAESSGK